MTTKYKAKNLNILMEEICVKKTVLSDLTVTKWEALQFDASN